MSEESSLLIQEYYKMNQFLGKPDVFFCSKTQGNALCGDSITIYLSIQQDTITDYRYDGTPAQITKAAAEFLGEFVMGEKITTVLTRDADRVRDQGFEVSHRRVRSSVSALLVTKNAIYFYKQDDILEEYEDVIE